MEKLFGQNLDLYTSVADDILSTIGTHDYVTVKNSEYESIARRDPLEGGRIYWSELLQRMHLAAYISLARHQRWISGVRYGYKDNNSIVFAASLRGFLESVADSSASLTPIPIYLAENIDLLRRILARQGRDIIFAPQLEEMLIHFSHARKIKRGDDVMPGHSAKTSREYLRKLEEAAGSKVHDLYSLLCEVTHPSVGSVTRFVDFDEDDKWTLHCGRNDSFIRDVVESYFEECTISFICGYNPPYALMKLLHKFKMFPIVPQLKRIDLSGVPAWQEIEEKINR